MEMLFLMHVVDAADPCMIERENENGNEIGGFLGEVLL